MTTGLILAIDQGTTNTKAILVDARARSWRRAPSPRRSAFPRPGWVERTRQRSGDGAGGRASPAWPASATPERVRRRIAVTNQRESVLVWERATGRPLGP